MYAFAKRELYFVTVSFRWATDFEIRNEKKKVKDMNKWDHVNRLAVHESGNTSQVIKSIFKRET